MENEKHELFDEDKMPDDAPVEYSFDILKNMDEDGRIRLPRHTGNTETKIDTLPGAIDLNTKTDPKLVWVTYDPLLERIICVHDAPDCVCLICKPIWEERQRENCIYQLEERRFIIMEYDDNDLEEV